MSKKDNKTRGDKVREKLYSMLDMPLDMIKNYSRITAIGSESILIENYKGISEYEEDIIRLSNDICIIGNSLHIEEITDIDMLITGNIKSIEFLK